MSAVPGKNARVTVARPQLVHTSALDAPARAAVRALLLDAFAGDFDEHDWEHALGGVHALLWEDGQPIGHAAVVQRRLLHRGRALRTGYVEAVGVRADRRGRGHGAALMAAVEQVVRGAYDVGALSAADEASPFYAARGWRRWRGPLSAFTPTGIRRLPAEEESVFVFEHEAVPLDLDGELTCDWRDGDLW
jgi:aminoglycoside 2'-N-acetyltransferase I